MKRLRTPIDRSKGQFARLMELDRRIRDGKYPNCLSFSLDWEVSQKTVQRDIDYLRDQLGAPLEYDRAKQGYYYTASNWFLPSVALNEGELLALLIAGRALDAYQGLPVADEAHRILGKLQELLPDRIELAPEVLFTRFSFTAPPARPVDAAVWKTVVRAITGSRLLEISYLSFGAEKPRKMLIEPYHLANLHGEWYLFGPCKGSGKVLQFALGRVRAARLQQQVFTLPEDFDPQALLSGAFGRYVAARETHKVRLLFSAEVAGWVTEKQWHSRQQVKRRKDGCIEIAFETGGLYEIFRWVLSWGRHCEVLAPKELKDWIRAEVKAMASGR